MVVEKLNHLLMGIKGPIEPACSDVLGGLGQTGVDDAALFGRVLIVGGGEFGAIHHRLWGENDSAAPDGCLDEVAFNHTSGGAKAAGKSDLATASNPYKCSHLREA
jgi:hypothetical protein